MGQYFPLLFCVYLFKQSDAVPSFCVFVYVGIIIHEAYLEFWQCAYS